MGVETVGTEFNTARKHCAGNLLAQRPQIEIFTCMQMEALTVRPRTTA